MLEFVLPTCGYLAGSVPMAIVVARAFGIPDPRMQGSRNPGATNILRYGGKFAAGLTLAGDVLKGAAAVLIARWLTDDPAVIAWTAGGAFIGHLYPVFFGFAGGKGVATALGVWLALTPPVGITLLVTWGSVAMTFRYSSLAATVAAIAAPFYVASWASAREYFVLSIAMSSLLLWRHRANIKNLLTGKESQIGS